MVLSAINHITRANNSPEVADSRHNPNNKPFEFKTWAQTIKNQKRSASFHNKPDNNNVANLENQTVFLQAINKYSMVIAASEFEGLNFKDRSLNLVLRDQFPKGIGLRERKIEDKMDALTKKFLILDKKIKVQTTMDKNSEVIRIGITNIPYEKDDKLKPLMIQLFEKYGSILEIGLHHTVDGGWFNGRGYVTLVKDKTKSYEPLTPQVPSWEQGHYLHIVWSNMKPICNYCHVDDHTRVNCPVLLRRRKACSICESTQHLKAQCLDAPWNRKRKQVTIHRSKVMNANVEYVNTEKDTAILSNLQEMDTEMPEEDNSKPDSTSVAEDKDDFQEAISTLDSVDEEKIDGSNLPIQIDEDSSQKKTGRKEATKRLLYPLVTFNSLYMNIQKRNNSEAFTPTSAVERSKKKSALFDDSLEVEENATFEDEYDENNSVPGGSSQPSTKLNL
ncbi:hypothetical protein G6F37_007851 [Rhizopus arrhizus]|nr:hypothetical protein G6F38_004346 [Rhizopus arrhizus]KAG1156181.1 hypothetical protein G6F37_007851 [Rhizopus arrhizus]